VKDDRPPKAGKLRSDEERDRGIDVGGQRSEVGKSDSTHQSFTLCSMPINQLNDLNDPNDLNH
jgi:hypothetical protein